MDLSNTPLDQVGTSAHAHYKAAEKAAGKSEEHYKAAGIYLKAAKLRVLKTKGLTWERWLKDHCPISRSRADEVIAISDGRKTVEENRERAREGMKATRTKQAEEANRRNVTADRSEKPNDFNDGPSKEQSSPETEPESDPVKEAEDINAKAHAQRIRVLRSRIAQATEDQLQQIEGILNV